VFRTLHSIKRIWGVSQASATWSEGDLRDGYTLHPAILDVSFQVGFATFTSLAEDTMGTACLPVGIRRILVDPTQQYRKPSREASVDIRAHLVKSTNAQYELDISAYDTLSKETGIQIDGLILRAIAEPPPSDDRLIFAKTIWDVDVAAGLPAPPSIILQKNELEYIDAIERTALFFMQNLRREIPKDQIKGFKPHHQALLRGIEILLEPVRQGRHEVLKKEWLNDSREIINSFQTRFADSADLALLTAVGENLPLVVRGESEMLVHMLKDDLLTRWNAEGRGLAECYQHAAHFAKKITYKHARAKILEIGAGTGGTTKAVLDAIGNAYASYTYTDISAGFFEKAAERFTDHTHRMEFKVLDIDIAPVNQGFTEASYDIIIAANVMHATRNLAQTMQNARSLLRPGGYLILVEVTGNMLRDPGLMGGLEGWWLGEKDGRFPKPGVSAKEWDRILSTTGFSGIDSITYDFPDISRHNCSTFVTQAVNEQFALLSDPLSSVELASEPHVLIVGGSALPVMKAARRAEKLLKRWTPHISTCASIESLDPSQIEYGTTVLCLAELDGAIFSTGISQTTLENLQELVGNAANLLWVTSGSVDHDPYSNMMVGIGRSLAFELPHLQIQFLDFDPSSTWDMDLAVQYLLRMVLLSSPEYAHHNMLWAQEPEILVKDDTPLIPRLIPDVAANDNLNAKQRRITKLASVGDRLEVSRDHSTASLIMKESPHILSEMLVVEVEFSMGLHSDRETPYFLCFGHVRGDGRAVLTLAVTEASVIPARDNDVYELTSFDACDVKTLAAVGSFLIASHIFDRSPNTGTIIVHNPTVGLTEAISVLAASKGRKTTFIVSTTGNGHADWVYINPFAQIRAVSQSVPGDASILWRLSEVAVDNVAACLPKSCEILRLDPVALPRQRATIAEAHNWATKAEIKVLPSVVKVNDLASYHSLDERLAKVLDWRERSSLSVVVQPIQLDGFFLADRTYFLVGLTGELGQSLCRFMISSGARHIVIASRNPANCETWVASLSSLGADVRALKMDATNRSQVRETVSEIRRTMPAIAGVANGAMVLEDSLFVNTTVDTVEKQLKPKVQGTINLDQEFAEDNLDFFIAFSSLSSIYGNPGQSIYNAANMFMTSLVEKRRRRGQAASVINIGMIRDVGVVAKTERETGKLVDHLRSQYYTPLSEPEFHHSFIQAVLCSPPDSANADVSIGIQPFVDDPNASSRPPWYKNPRFSHMIFTPASTNSTPAQATSSAKYLREKLEETTSPAEAEDSFQDLFCMKIESMLKVPADTINREAPLSDLGLDSLLAVEIRTWLLKEIGVDVPLLGILSRDSISSITPQVVEHYIGEKAATVQNGLTEQNLQLNEPESVVVPDDADQSSAADSFEMVESDSASLQVFNSAEYTPLSGATSDSEGSVISVSKGSKPAKQMSSVDSSWQTEPTLDILRTERMSFPQASMHFMLKILDDPTVFNVTAQFTIRGHLNVNRFARALSKTLAQHEAYQTCFFVDPGTLQVCQGIASGTPEKRFTHMHSTKDEDVQNTVQAFADRRWDLASGQTFHTTLITHAPDTHTVVFGCHHMVMDGTSWGIFLRDLDRAYQMAPVHTPTKSYMDFARHQAKSLESGALEDSIGYWLRHLDPIPLPLPLLPYAQRKRPQSQRSYSNYIARRELGVEVVDKIKNASKSSRATAMHFYLAVVAGLFSRLLDLDDICIGVTDAGRGEFKETIGHFTNLLPMRLRIDREKTFVDLLNDTTRTVLNGLEHSQVPIDVLMERLGTLRSSTSSPLFQLAFNYRIGDLYYGKLGNCSMELDQLLDAKTPYDMTFNVTQTASGGHLIELASNDYLYSSAATEMIMDIYIASLDAISSDQSGKLKESRFYSDAQVESALALGRGPQVQHSWSDSLIERIGQVCEAFPDSVAIKDDQGFLTYKQLARRVEAIAVALVNARIEPGSRVAVLCEPSIDTYAAMLGILHVGSVYVPLDLSLPVARRRVLLETSQSDLLIFHSATADIAVEHPDGGALIPMLNLSEVPNSTDSPPPVVSGADYDFLLFTSGSTGTPKGVKVTQGGIMNYAAAKKELLNLGRVKVLQQSSTGFDMSLAQAFNAFANAGTLVVAPLQSRGDPSKIAALMARESIEFTICTPTEYLTLSTYAADSMRQCESWQYACSGGEAVTDSLISELQRLELPSLSLVDCYGPTELSCALTFRAIPIKPGMPSLETPYSVGKAIPNTSIYIGSDSGEPLPVGFPGEICVGGRGVARGYFGLTAASPKFVRDPFSPSENALVYKTGDKGCLREDGSLMLLGRMDGDTLVKLRGLRIELSEVEDAILKAAKGSLTDAIVTVRGDPGFLVAHVVFARGEQMTQNELDGLCSHLPLPRYMIPSMIIPMDRLPMTSNGKVDRRAVAALPLPTRVQETVEQGRLTVVEGELRLIWRDVLGEAAGAANIGADSDFFTVGGSSLLLVRLQNEIKEKMGANIELRDLYQASTLRMMAAASSAERSQLVPDDIDWAQETAIPESILSIPKTQASAPPREKQREVVLTGAAGFLGAELLAALIAQDDVAKIHCIAVPANSRHKIPPHAKVVVYDGSLMSPNLGLSKSEIATLQESMDQIIHAGAQGHCLNNYFSVKNANYVSTRFLASLALPRRVPLHLISSPRVILQSGSYSVPPVSMAAHLPPLDGSQGYTSTKWASEVFLENLASQTDLPITIHRACSLIGDSAPHDDAMNSIIRYSILSRTVPDVANTEGYFDFRDVSEVAAEIANAPVTQNLVAFRHYSSGVKVPWNKLSERMEVLYGGTFEMVPMDDWVRTAVGLGIEELIVSYLEANIVGAGRLVFPYMGEAA
jgi:aspyridone synthetase (hybrid polyketide synthase/nonribosomal peptide synthetase)